MSLRHKKIAIFLGILVLLTGIFFIAIWRKIGGSNPDITNLIPSKQTASPTAMNVQEDAAVNSDRWQTPTYRVNEAISPTSSIEETGYMTMVNNYCHLTYEIPADWSVFGFLGESQLISPKNGRDDAAWREANRELIENAEGEAFLYPQYRSLYISCHEAKARSEQYALKTLIIDGIDAYEVSSTGAIAEESITTTYTIVAEKDGVTYEILLDHTEYDNLSDTVKGIIDSISFED